jgi:hypothetical protein
MPETVDTLTFDVGLTSDEFQAGVDRILGSMERMQGAAEETGEGMSASFASLGESVAGLAWRFASMFLAFKSIEGLVDYFKDLSVELAHVGLAGEYLGQSALELRRFGEVSEKAGGQAHDAISAMQSLNAAIFGLEYQGQVSQNLVMLSRLRVAYLDANGRPLALKEIAFNAAKALQEQLPGEANQAMRVQFATQIFGAGGIANAVGGPLKEFEKFYASAVGDNRKITDKSIDRQVELQRAVTGLSYQVKDNAAAILDKLTPAINSLIRTIQTELIPTIDELIADLMSWLHPMDMLSKAAEGPTGLRHPINDLAHLGAWLGEHAADVHDWFARQTAFSRKSMLDTIRVPSQVTARMAPGANLDALKYLHLEAGGDAGDPTWSKALTVYASLGAMPGGADAFAHSLFATGLLNLVPSVPLSGPQIGALSTPSAARPPVPAPGVTGGKPIASLSGPRVQIDSIGPIVTQATDANGLMADINRAVQRKLLVAQSDPGLA